MLAVGTGTTTTVGVMEIEQFIGELLAEGKRTSALIEEILARHDRRVRRDQQRRLGDRLGAPYRGRN